MARMARAPAMRLALSDTADREAFGAALDATPLGSFRDAGESLVHRHSLLQARPPGSSPAWPRQWTAATRGYCSLMGQGRETLLGVDALGMPAFSPRSFGA